jgi:3-oxoacyl-[acyl-carrier-protein] synthase III
MNHPSLPWEAGVRGQGLYAPGQAVSNAEVKRLAGVEFDAERLEARLGIRTRHIARLRGIHETTADFACRAAEAALRDAGAEAAEMDLIVVGTDTPEFVSPATAIVVQGRLQGGERPAMSFDVGASCAGFVTAFDAAARIVATDPAVKKALVIGVYNMPAHLRDGDAFGWSIFADGAAAFVLEKRDAPGYLAGSFRTDGTQWNYVGVYAGGTRKPVTREILDKGTYGLELLQRLPGDRNVKLWPPLVHDLLKKAGLGIRDVDHILFTQINRSVIEEVMGILGLPMGKTTTVMDRYGYTGSACVPMAFCEAVKAGSIRRGDKVVLVASGAGLAVGANLFVY